MKNMEHIIKAIHDKPWDFALHQLLFIVEQYKNKEFASNQTIYHEPALLKANFSFTVPSSDVVKYSYILDDDVFTLNQSSLIGINGALPQVYTEKILDKIRENNTRILDFLNIFHQRYFGLSHKIAKYANVSLQSTAKKHYIEYLGGLHSEIPIHKLLQNMTSFVINKPKNKNGFLAILKSVFCCDFQIEEFVASKIPIYEKNQACLDQSALKDKLLGNYATCRYQTIKLIIKVNKLKEYVGFLKGAKNYNLISELFLYYAKSGMKMIIEVQLNFKEEKRTKLSSTAKVGQTAWCMA